FGVPADDTASGGSDTYLNLVRNATERGLHIRNHGFWRAQDAGDCGLCGLSRHWIDVGVELARLRQELLIPHRRVEGAAKKDDAIIWNPRRRRERARDRDRERHEPRDRRLPLVAANEIGEERHLRQFLLLTQPHLDQHVKLAVPEFPVERRFDAGPGAVAVAVDL